LCFLTKAFSAVRNFKKGFAGEGSSRGYTGRTFKGFADSRLWMLLKIFGTFLGFGKIPFLVRVYGQDRRSESVIVYKKQEPPLKIY
jgi:hypothetical protein